MKADKRLYAVHVKIERDTIMFVEAATAEDARLTAQTKPFVVEASLGELVTGQPSE